VGSSGKGAERNTPDSFVSCHRGSRPEDRSSIIAPVEIDGDGETFRASSYTAVPRRLARPNVL